MANKRINRLESSKVLSPALHAVLNSGGKFYAKGADLKQLQHEYARCINFLNMGTSTVTTARQYERTIAEKLGGQLIAEKTALPQSVIDFGKASGTLTDEDITYVCVYRIEKSCVI